MKTTIRVSCVDQVLKIVDRPLLASGGLNEAVVAFDFCEKWNGYAKTGVFYRDEDEAYYSILDDDDICVIPWEVYSTPGYFYFTVFGDKGDVRRTANTLKYKAQKGLAGSDMLPSDPTLEVYDQIMGRLAKIEGDNGGYYTPEVTQLNENTMKVSFTASKGGMPSVAAQDITLPAGKDYVLTEADMTKIAEQAAGMVEIPEGSDIELDTSLTASGKAADAKAVGDALNGKLSKSGGTMTGKIVFPTGNINVGFSNSEDVKIFGYGSIDDVPCMRIGDVKRVFQIRGNENRPKYNNTEIALIDDIPSVDGFATEEYVDAAISEVSFPADYVDEELMEAAFNQYDTMIKGHIEEVANGAWEQVTEYVDTAIDEIEITTNADWIATKEPGSGDVVYISEQKLTSGIWSKLQMSMQPGLNYAVTFNDEVYFCEARAYGQGVTLGNDPSLSLNDDPFCIQWAGGNATSGMFFKRSDISYPITIKVTDYGYVYNKMPVEYLPNEAALKSEIPTDDHINGLINTALSAIPNAAEVAY